MATERSQVHKCSVCGAMTEVSQGGAGTLVCCNQPMDLMTENTTDAAQEKHVPVVEPVEGGGFKVTVGSVAHPMADDHWITWIEILTANRTCRVDLNPGDPPEAFFPLKDTPLAVRAYCNLHGLWKAE